MFFFSCLFYKFDTTVFDNMVLNPCLTLVALLTLLCFTMFFPMLMHQGVELRFTPWCCTELDIIGMYHMAHHGVEQFETPCCYELGAVHKLRYLFLGCSRPPPPFVILRHLLAYPPYPQPG